MLKKSEKSASLRILEKILKVMAVLVLKKHNPQIVSITGSVGKTSAKEAISRVLEANFQIRKGEKNYNNEIGLPLTIIGAKSGGKSLIGWAGVFFQWLGTLFFRSDYPEVLILEMGADRPGDIKYLTGFIKSKIGVLTDISGSHLEFFKTLEGVAREKGTLIKSLGKPGAAVLNADNSHVLKIKEQSESRTITFGFSEDADVRAEEIFYDYSKISGGERKISGIGFKLIHKGTIIPIRLKNVLARHSIYAALAAASVGIEMGINLVEIGEALSDFCLPPGRMTLILGIKNTQIIDDSYNSSPASAKAALSVLADIEAKRKIAVLGDMLELGKDSAEKHLEIINDFFKKKGEIILLVGKRMKEAIQKISEKREGEADFFVFDDPISAGRKLQEIMREGDLILVKGSQGMWMEKVLEEVIADPEKASEILCRQDKKWKERPWRPV